MMIYVIVLAVISFFLLMVRSTNDTNDLDNRLLLFIFGMSMFSLLLAALFNYQPHFVEEDDGEVAEDDMVYHDRQMKS